MRPRVQRWWMLTYPREWWVMFAVWQASTLLFTHFVLHGGTDLTWFLAYLICGVICYGLALLARFIPAWHRHRL